MLRPKNTCWLGVAAGLILFLSLTTARAEPPVELCKQHAENYARQKTSGHVFRGAVVGSGTGAIIGGLFGGAGVGAAAGLGLGVIGGGAQRSSDYRNVYTDAFVDCMTGG